jgi:hypothetical protein
MHSVTHLPLWKAFLPDCRIDWKSYIARYISSVFTSKYFKILNLALLKSRNRQGYRVKIVFDVHTSKASKELKVVLLRLWRVKGKTTRGFILFHSGIFTWNRAIIILRTVQSSYVTARSKFKLQARHTCIFLGKLIDLILNFLFKFIYFAVIQSL